MRIRALTPLLILICASCAALNSPRLINLSGTVTSVDLVNQKVNLRESVCEYFYSPFDFNPCPVVKYRERSVLYDERRTALIGFSRYSKLRNGADIHVRAYEDHGQLIADTIERPRWIIVEPVM